jgi:hypothetical protein
VAAVSVPLGIGLGWFAAYRTGWLAERTAAASPARFSSVTHDFGKVAQGQSLQCEFRYSNVSGEDLRVRSVRSSCGCIVDQSRKSWLSPGESDVIRVTLNTEAYEPPKPLNKRVLVQFEPREAPPAVLTVKAIVSPDVVSEPGRLVCRERTGFGESVFELTLKRGMLRREAFAAVELASPESYYDIENLSRSEDKIDFRITILHGKAPAYPRPLFVRYHVDSGLQREIQIPVEFEHSVDEVVLVPKQYFQIIQATSGPPDLARTTRQQFRLLPGKHKRSKIARIDARDERSLAWEIEGGPKSDRFSVWVKELPTRQLYSTTLDIHYASGPDGNRGVASLDATVFVRRNHSVR